MSDSRSRLRVLEILFEPQPARRRALHRTRLDAIAGAMEEELAARRCRSPILPVSMYAPNGGGLRSREPQKQRERIGLQPRPQPIGVIDLVGVAGPNQLLELVEYARVLLGRHGRLPAFFGHGAGFGPQLIERALLHGVVHAEPQEAGNRRRCCVCQRRVESGRRLIREESRRVAVLTSTFVLDPLERRQHFFEFARDDDLHRPFEETPFS